MFSFFLQRIRRIRKKPMKAREIRDRFGTIAISNCTDKEIDEGIERQWKRLNDPLYQQEEQKEQLKKLYSRK